MPRIAPPASAFSTSGSLCAAAEVGKEGEHGTWSMAPGGDHGRCGTGLLGQRERRLAGERGAAALRARSSSAAYRVSPSRSGPSERPIRTGVVSPGCVYRSGQPKERGFEWLKEQGFRGLVNLREENPDLDAAAVRKAASTTSISPSGPPAADGGAGRDLSALRQRSRQLAAAAPLRRWPGPRGLFLGAGSPLVRQVASPARPRRSEEYARFPGRSTASRAASCATGPKTTRRLRAPRSRHGGDEPGAIGGRLKLSAANHNEFGGWRNLHLNRLLAQLGRLAAGRRGSHSSGRGSRSSGDRSSIPSMPSSRSLP